MDKVTLEDLLKNHAEIVKASSDAWVKMVEAQEEYQRIRDAEHKSADRIRKWLKSTMLELVPLDLFNEKFKPTKIISHPLFDRDDEGY